MTEADPDIEEGGGHIELEWGWCGHVAHGARTVFFRMHIMHSVLEGSCMGACSHKKMFSFRPYEGTSEAVGDHRNHTKFMATGL